MDELFEKMKKIIAEKLDVDERKITVGSQVSLVVQNLDRLIHVG